MSVLIPLLIWISFHQYEGGNIIPVINQYQGNVTARVGGAVELRCPISAMTDSSLGFYISWTVNGIDENMLSVDTRYQFKDSNKILEVSNLRSEDSGIYVCKGVTGYGVKEASFYLVIKDDKYCRIPVNATPRTRFKPCFLNSLMQNEATYHKIVRDIGSSVEFDCSAAGSPSPKYLWMKGKSSADWIDNITGIRQPILRINRVRVEYSGYYTCKVSNQLGEISYTYTLIVREKHSKVPRITNDLGNITANVGAQAMLVGSIICNCKPVLQWFKRINNQSLANKQFPIPNPRIGERNEFYTIIDADNSDSPIETMEKSNDVLVSILKFKSVVPEDAGKYVLFATNGNYGMSYGVAYLEVREDPESSKKNHPRLVLYIAIPIFILILCFGVIFYCWSRRHSAQRVDCPKRFCIGSPSLSSSANKSLRSHYPGSTTTASATTTGKCSNGSSSIFGNKVPIPSNDAGNVIPLLPANQNCNRPFPSNDSTILESAPNQSFIPHFPVGKDVSPYSYSKMPVQQVVFPHSNSRISNSSQPNTLSGSSNCSEHTSRSNPNPIQQPIVNHHNQSINQSQPITQMFSPMPTYLMSPGDHCYTPYSEGLVQASSANMYYTQDYFPPPSTASPGNAFSFS